MLTRLTIIVAVVLFSQTTFAACVLLNEPDEKNFTQCSVQAEKGDAEAQFVLASMIYEGKAVEQDYDKSIQWFLKSAEQGHAMAQASLGMAYARGVGIPEDQVTALKWMNIADANGLESISLYRTTLMSLMTADQKEQAKFLSEAWLEKH